MPSDLEPGNIVELKTSSPTMVIGAIDGESAKCFYYNENEKKIVEITIPLEALKNVEHNQVFHPYRNEI